MIITLVSCPQSNEIIGHYFWTRCIKVLSSMIDHSFPGKLLSLDDKMFHATVASDCIIMEKICSLHKTLGCHLHKVQVEKRRV